MAVYRAQISFPFDTAFPRDAMTINPHYNGDNAQGLADALKSNLIANVSVGAATPFGIKVYDAQKAPPSYPLATATNGTGFSTSSAPRELALCLSYYSTWNRPSYRGRVFIPHAFIQGALSQRPTGGQMGTAGVWATTLGANLPAQMNWAVWSPKLQQSFTINHWWVDDEWDVMRSRGLKPTTRTVGTIP
jgi:hypothetical protein